MDRGGSARVHVPERGDDPLGVYAEIRALRMELAHARAELSRSRALERHARHRALHDPLTGLPNRHAFDGHVQGAIATSLSHGRPFALLYFDLDGFKRVNDAHGHATGDALLRVVGARLARAMRAEDIISRYGGDEFIGLVCGVHDERRAAAIAAELAGVVADSSLPGQAGVRVEASIGIALHPRDGATLEALVASADAAMFRAKRGAPDRAPAGSDAHCRSGVRRDLLATAPTPAALRS